MQRGNKVAARIAHEYLTLGKDVKLPIVPPEWLLAVKNAQSETGLQHGERRVTSGE